MFCENCGKEIRDDSVFCEFCGTRLCVEEPDIPNPDFAISEIPRQDFEIPEEKTPSKLLTVIFFIIGFLIIGAATYFIESQTDAARIKSREYNKKHTEHVKEADFVKTEAAVENIVEIKTEEAILRSIP